MMMMMMTMAMAMSSSSAPSSPVFPPFRSFTRIHPHRLPRLSNRLKLRAPAPQRIPMVVPTSAGTVSRISSTSIKLDKEKVTEQDEGKESHGFLRKKLAVFVSGGGSNFQTIHKASMENKIYGDISVVVSDKPDCKACDYARNNNIPVIEYPKRKAAENEKFPTELVASLRKYEIDYVLLAGYLKLLPPELVQAYPRAILNIHPALLPAFGGKGYYGRKVHEAVIKSGARYSGPTIHFVDEKYDHGIILAQRVVPVLPYDTADDLAARVLKEEHDLYPEVVAAVCEDRISWRDDGVPIIRRSWQGSEFY